ncbi:hypothetical protein IQ268_28275 [Oculatella sp. LEGE 06141]|uniref:hypothetical protein n=1 Tax=Oculatella sp. LEGE 06141 TaxID=1828648 RepID=UPI00187FB1D1|nr:hypothetical protein [Oculatella sp. LEGE 06141]MBE9182450.1 hypothetical protein [Oculatella sp. LEGE 06141]
MKFSTEKELQNYCLRVLRSKGIQCSEEVECGDIRADIVIPQAVIELKKVLNREGIYQALGQATAYNRHLKRPEIWLVGQRPIAVQERAQAERLAQEIEQDRSITVSFIDDPFWEESMPYQNLFAGLTMNMNRSLGFVSGCAIALIIGGIAASRSLSSSPPTSPSSSSAPVTSSSFFQNPILRSDDEDAPGLASSANPPLAQQVQQVEEPYLNEQQGHRLTSCQGHSFANFREFPSLSPTAILGAVEAGQTVQLTGRQIESDGVLWYEAIAPQLRQVIESSAQNKLDPNQVGWIASCFVN